MAAPPQDTLRWAWGPLGTSMGTRQGPRDLGRRCASVPSEPRSRWLWRACGAAGASGPVRERRQEPAPRSASLAAPALDHGKQQRLPLNRFTLGLFLGMFRRITAAASRLLTADGADGSFYSLESLNARVRSMIPTHPALVLLWCQILLLVSHTDYRWWAEVQQTPRRRSLSSRKSLSPPASGEEEDSAPAPRPGVCNREIVRRGALILFCDYVVSAKCKRWRGGRGSTPRTRCSAAARHCVGTKAELVFHPALTGNKKADSRLVLGFCL